MDAYRDLHLNYISGEWRPGAGSAQIVDTNPYDGSELAVFQAASLADLDEAYESAAAAQLEWAGTNPYQFNAIMNKAVQIMQTRYDEIIDWLVHEAGSTVLKAHIELDSCIGVTARAAGYPFLLETTVSPSLLPNKTNYTIRKPVGVVGVIGPFNFPMFLAMRTVAPALAAGNGVVLKPSSSTPITGGTLIARIFEEDRKSTRLNSSH